MKQLGQASRAGLSCQRRNSPGGHIEDFGELIRFPYEISPEREWKKIGR